MMQNENKFKCPCHGSQYNNEGKVVRGPAPLVRLLGHAARCNDSCSRAIVEHVYLTLVSLLQYDMLLDNWWSLKHPEP